MPIPSIIDQQTEAGQRIIRQLIGDNAYGNYIEIARRLADEHGITIGKSALGKFGKTLKALDQATPDRKYGPETQLAIYKLGLAFVAVLEALQKDRPQDPTSNTQHHQS